MAKPESQNRPWLRGRGSAVLAALVVAALAVVPWCRNHGSLRDFMDYGLVIAANARIQAGERPYRDFATPVQTGTFLLNGAAERAFGGTYLGMTWGGALATVAAGAALAWLLARCWPVVPAALVALAVTAASFSQHTIIWYNAVGVGCLAVAAWGGAVAPALRRQDRAWHAAVAAALFLGGINKLSYQLLALAVLVGWALRAWWQGRASAGRAAATVAWVLAIGLVAPVAFELAWTGVPVSVWWHNVVALPLGSRSHDLLRAFSWAGLWRPVSVFYGPLSLPCTGALCLALPAGAWLAGWRRTAGDRVWAAGAALLAAAGGLALLATNYEIDYVGAAGALALTVAIWLGFGLPAHGWRFAAVVLAPAALLVVTAGESAWRGQRSQFGHSVAPRASFRDAGAAGAEYAYFSGLKVSPEWMDALRFVKTTLPPAGANGLRPVFYSQGLEWLERPFPAVKHRGLALWMFFGPVYGREETVQLARVLGADSTLERYYVATAWNYLDPAVARALYTQYALEEVAGVVGYWKRRPDALPLEDVEHSLYDLARTADGINLLNQLGWNIDPACFTINRGNTVLLPATAASAAVVGATAGRLELRGRVQSRRLQGEAVLRRTGAGVAPVSATFEVRVPGVWDAIWSGTARLGAGDSEQVMTFEIRGDYAALEFDAQLPTVARSPVCAGFRRLRLMHTLVDTPPPRLRGLAPPDDAPAPEAFRRCLPGGAWRLAGLVSRGAKAVPEGLLLPPGAELWFKADPMLPELRGELRRAPSGEPDNPVLRLVWRRGARIDLLVQEPLRDTNGALRFRGWNAEGDGWFGLLADPGPSAAAALIRFEPPAP